MMQEQELDLLALWYKHARNPGYLLVLVMRSAAFLCVENKAAHCHFHQSTDEHTDSALQLACIYGICHSGLARFVLPSSARRAAKYHCGSPILSPTCHASNQDTASRSKL